jgi:hypothetical protein
LKNYDDGFVRLLDFQRIEVLKNYDDGFVRLLDLLDC